MTDGLHTIYARAYDAAGNVSSIASDTLTVGTPPTITGQPLSATKIVGESVTFSVTASGTAPLSYQWRKDGTSISGATSSSYTISSVVLSDAGSYDVIVSNAFGSATSNSAALTVNSPQIGSVTVSAQSPITVYPTANASYTITITRGAGTGAFTANLSMLTALPSGCTASFSPSAVSFLATDNTKASTLTISTTSGSTPIGAASFTVKAEVSGTPADFATCSGTLTVGGVGSVTMGTQSPNPVYASDSATYAVTVNRSGGTGPFSVNLSIVNSLPSGCTYSFSPSTVSFSSGDASKTSTLTISTSSSTPAVSDTPYYKSCKFK